MANEEEDEGPLSDVFGCIPDIDDVPEMVKPMVINRAVHLASAVVDMLDEEGKLAEILTTWSTDQIAKHVKELARKHLEEGH